jgi:capsular exopolysaccharide synthesis family protein
MVMTSAQSDARKSRPSIRATADAGQSLQTATEHQDTRPWLVPGSDEIFRGIYTRAGTGEAETLAICSALAGEGKSTIALGLAVTIAQDFPRRRVLLVETDLHRPVLARDFELEPSPGLIDCLLDDEPLQMAYRPTTLHNLQLLPAGAPRGNPGRILRSERMVSAVETMSQGYDTVILDVPAILANSDSLLLTDLADGVIFVVRAGVTPLPLVNKAISQMADGKLRGAVLNGAASSVPNWLRRLCGL